MKNISQFGMGFLDCPKTIKPKQEFRELIKAFNKMHTTENANACTNNNKKIYQKTGN